VTRSDSSITSFEQLLLEAIDDALSLLGESVKISILLHLGNRFKIEKEEIPHRVDEFQNALEQIFGLGTRYLEILIMKSLNSKMRFFCEEPTHEWPEQELTFCDYVNLMKRNFEETCKNQDEIGILVNDVKEQEQYH
jgi:hypothetical protein